MKLETSCVKSLHISAVISIIMVLVLIFSLHFIYASAESGLALNNMVDEIILASGNSDEASITYAKWLAANPDQLELISPLQSNDTVFFRVKWSVKDQSVQAGDYFAVLLSDISLNEFTNTGIINDTDGVTVANYTVVSAFGSGMTVTITFTENAVGRIGLKGDFWCSLVTKQYSSTTTVPLSFTVNGVLQHYQETEVIEYKPPEAKNDPAAQNNAKWGVSDPQRIATIDGKEYYIFFWDIWVNMDFDTIENFTITDTIPSHSPHKFISTELGASLGNNALGIIQAREYIGADYINTPADPQELIAARYEQFKDDFNGLNGRSWQSEAQMRNQMLGDATLYPGIDGGAGVIANDFIHTDKEFTINLGRVTRPMIITYRTIAEIELYERALGDKATMSQFTNSFSSNGETQKTASVQTYYFGAGGSSESGSNSFQFRKTDEAGNALGGAYFYLYKDEACQGASLAIGQSTAEGLVSFGNLGLGPFYMKEIVPPPGYQLCETIFKIEFSGSTATIYEGEGFVHPLADNRVVNYELPPVELPPTSLEPVNIELRAMKNLQGSSLKADMFGFSVEDSQGGLVASAVNEADGSIIFNSISLAQAGVYAYKVKENIGQAEGISYDETEYTVIVTVWEDNGLLQADISYPQGSLVFNNSYTEPEKDDPEEDSKDNRIDENEPDENEPDKNEPDKNEPDKNENDDNSKDDNRHDDNNTDDNRHDNSNTDENKPDENEPDENEPDENEPDENEPDENEPDENEPDENLPPAGGDNGGLEPDPDGGGYHVWGSGGESLGHLTPQEDGSYIYLDDDGVPLGKWTLDEEGVWIYDAFPPLADFLPQTGVFQGPTLLLMILGVLLLGLGFGLKGKRCRM